jgi:hypothetical protein
VTIEELYNSNETVRAICDEAKTPKKLDSDFCRGELLHGMLQERGKVGLFHHIEQQVPLEFQEMVRNYCRVNAPSCRRADCTEAMCSHRYLVDEATDGHIEIFASDYLKLTPEQKVGKKYTLKRDPQPAVFGGIIERLRHAAGGPEPNFIDLSKPLPDDSLEPVYIVRDEVEVRNYAADLHIRERAAANELTPWYVKNAFYTCDARARRAVLELRKPEDVTGALAWKPVVLTFRDDDIERCLQKACTQVVTVLPDKEGHLSLAAVRDAIKVVAMEKHLGISDMSPEVLDGWLGRVCKERMGDFPIAFAWPALLSAASVLMPRSENNRTNLFTCLAAGKGTGKSSAFDYALWLLNVKTPELMRLKAGSAEGLTSLIGDIGGAPRLYHTDELEHLLVKAAIQGASFASILNTAWNQDEQPLVVARGKNVSFNCRLSLSGCIVDEKFDDLFGVATTGGFWDRFMWGVGPSGYVYNYRPFRGEPVLKARDSDEFSNENRFEDERPVSVEFGADVWAERDRIAKELKIKPEDRRVLEIGLRCAVIAAAFDGRRTLNAADLGPMKAFVKYQIYARTILKPNPGKNPDAVVAGKLRDYLERHSPKGEWLNRRKMIQMTNTQRDFGPAIVNKALQALEQCGDVEQSKIGQQKLVRKVK